MFIFIAPLKLRELAADLAKNATASKLWLVVLPFLLWMALQILKPPPCG